MDKPTEAYPLTWPPGWRRTPVLERVRAQFGAKRFVDRGVNERGERQGYYSKGELSIGEATGRVLQELGAMGFNKSVIISSDMRLRNDGLPISRQRTPDDPGVSVFWGNGKAARCMAVDRYNRIADNLAAIAATLEAMRAIERHGGAAILERAFTGFVALPAPEQWWQVLGVSSHATKAEIDEAYRKLAQKHHPDRGGDASQMSRINSARADGIGRLSS